MAKRRNLKKSINYICGELFAECVSIKLCKKDICHEELDNIMKQILEMHKDLISRISHTEPGNTKGFYKKLKFDLSKYVNEITNSIAQIG